MGRKRVSPDWLMEDEIPPSDDPRWAGWVAVVSVHLTEPRSAKQLAALIPTYSFPLITNVLSWMDVRGLAGKDKTKRPVLWGLLPPPPPKRPPPTHCATCGGNITISPSGLICIFCGRFPL